MGATRCSRLSSGSDPIGPVPPSGYSGDASEPAGPASTQVAGRLHPKPHLLFDPRREHLPSRPQKINRRSRAGPLKAGRACAATRQGLALIGPSTAAKFGGREESAGLSNYKPVVCVDLFGVGDTPQLLDLGRTGDGASDR